MNSQIPFKLKTLTSVFALSMSLLPQVQAQEAANEESFLLEEIIVTAQKREQSLQDVPVAVTALTAGALESLRVENALDLQFNAPNLMINRNSNFTIRGVGTLLFGGSVDAGVGKLRNGVYLQASLATTELYDLERVEILRGPQGTLFGRNTTGGAVNFISQKAADATEGSIEVQVENDGGTRSTGTLNFPLSENISQRFAFNTVNRDGYTENKFTGNDIDGRDQYSIRSSTHFEFGEASADLVLEYYDEDSNRSNSPKALCLPDPVTVCSVEGVATAYPTSNYRIDQLFLGSAVRADRYLENPSDLRVVNIDSEPTYSASESIVSFEVNIPLGDLMLTSVTGYQNAELHSFRDFDLGAAPFGFNPGDHANIFGQVNSLADDGQGNGIFTYAQPGGSVTTTSYLTTQIADVDVEQFSQEIRLSSDYDSAFNYVAGVYYLDFKRSAAVGTYLPATAPLGASSAGTDSMAVFGEGYWDVADNVQITAGIRFTTEDKYQINGEGAGAPRGDADFEETTGRLAVSWNPTVDFTDDTMVYASLAKGYKSGGFNVGNLSNPTYDPEYVTSLEFGAKNTLMDNRVFLNAAVFRTDYENLGLGNLVGTNVLNTNVPKSIIQGFELEVVAVPIEALRLESSVGVLNAEIDSDFLSSDPSRSGDFFQLKGNELPNSPSKTFKLAAEYTFELANEWKATPRLDYYWQDEFYSREFNTGADTVEAWEQVDFQVAFENAGSPWKVTAFIKNVLDDDSITHIETNSDLVGSFKNIFLLEPRTFAISVKYSMD